MVSRRILEFGQPVHFERMRLSVQIRDDIALVALQKVFDKIAADKPAPPVTSMIFYFLLPPSGDNIIYVYFIFVIFSSTGKCA